MNPNSVSDLERKKQPTHQHEGVLFQVIPVSPSNTHTELQIVCFFDQSKNQTYAGGTEAVDEHFHGEIRKLRAEALFQGERFESMVIHPSQNQIPAKKLLMLGLGDPETLTLDTLASVGRIAVQEALKLKVSEFCFAPSLKDAGFSGLPAADVSVVLARGMAKAITTAHVLNQRKLVEPVALKEVIFLAGAQHLENSQAGLKKIFG